MTATEALLQLTRDGLFCPAGRFWIDPWRPVERAVLTHAHADHARPGSERYLAAAEGELVLRRRLGPEARIEAVPYGAEVDRDGVRVSLHPAGHVLGSAQVRLEHRGQVCVVSGDYKAAADPTCAVFEPVACHHFVTESTFGLPVFRWPETAEVVDELHAWWRGNQEQGKASLLYAYALGKAQRLLASIDPSIGPIWTHGAVENLVEDYRGAGVPLPPTRRVSEAPDGTDWSRALVVAPPSAHATPWMRRFGALSTAFASGWMALRGTRRRRSVDRGFVLSDHADWGALIGAIEQTGAQRVWVTHGYREPLVRWLEEAGLEARAIAARFESEGDDR